MPSFSRRSSSPHRPSWPARWSHLGAAALAGALTAALAPAALAADTVETWDVGATDLDFYAGVDGLGGKREDRAIFGDLMLGYGIVERLSAYVGSTVTGSNLGAKSTTTHYLGMFGTPLETSHVDIDVFLDFSAGGADDTFELRPALELNVDADAEMATWGIYLRAPFPIYGRKVDTPLHPSSGLSETTMHIESTFGAYAMAAPGHQLLLEYDMGYHPSPSAEERVAEVGGIALGYNLVVASGLETIHQVVFDIPQGGERASVSVMTGFIATLPAGRR